MARGSSSHVHTQNHICLSDRSVRPSACPNPGFMGALLDLEEAALGSRSANLPATRRGKPATRTCPCCGEPAGISSRSLAVHMRTRHRQH